MAVKEKRKYCPICGKNVLAQKQKINHILHFLLGFVTCFIWWIIWIILLISNSMEGYKCHECGSICK